MASRFEAIDPDAVAYITEDGYASVGFIERIEDDLLAVRDPVLGNVDVAPGETAHVLHTPTASVGSFIDPLSEAWSPEMVRHWREVVCKDWRTVLLLSTFAMSRMWSGLHEFVGEAMLRSLDGKSFPNSRVLGVAPGSDPLGIQIWESLIDYAPGLHAHLADSNDFTRGFRNRVCLRQFPRGLSLPLFSMLVSLLGRDAASLMMEGDVGEPVFDGAVSRTILFEHTSSESRLQSTAFFDPSHYLPHANAQWLCLDHSCLMNRGTRVRPRPGREPA